VKRLLWLLTCAAAACSDAYLDLPQPAPAVTTATTMNVSGRVCTADPASLLAPVKILFMLDYSQSMVVSDPDTVRATAAVDLMDKLGKAPGLEFGVMLFRGDQNIITKTTLPDGSLQDGFTPSLQIDTAALRVVLGAGLPAPTTVDQETTDFVGALARARALIEDDILANQAQPDLLERSKYVVIFLSDGIPTRNLPQGCLPGDGRLQCTCPGVISDGVDKIQLLQNDGVGLVQLDSVYIFDNPNAPPVPIAVHQTAASLLACMAQHGAGDFRDFANGEPVDFFGFSTEPLQRLYLLKNLLVVNRNARPGTFAPDSDGDGLSDDEELLLGSNPLDPDTDHDGFGDLLESKFPQNFHLLTPDPGCAPADQGDRDGDGLKDCEEIFIGTSASRFDSDRDGAPDGIEWWMGTRPAVADLDDDPDRDGLTNGAELRAHTNPNLADSANLADIAQRLTISSEGAPVNGRSCYQFRAENIHLANTLARNAGDEPGLNDIWITAAQVPFDAPDSDPVYSMTIVQARLDGFVRTPANGEITVTADQFTAPVPVPPPTTTGTTP
jgi:hypothetical protein